MRDMLARDSTKNMENPWSSRSLQKVWNRGAMMQTRASPVSCVDVDEEGKRVAITFVYGTLEVWRIGDDWKIGEGARNAFSSEGRYERIITIIAHADAPYPLPGDDMSTMDPNTALAVMNTLPAGETLKHFSDENTKGLGPMCRLSRSSSLVVTSGSDIALWDCTDGLEIARFALSKKDSMATRLHISPDGRTIVASSTIYLYVWQDCELTDILHASHIDDLLAAAALANSKPTMRASTAQHTSSSKNFWQNEQNKNMAQQQLQKITGIGVAGSGATLAVLVCIDMRSVCLFRSGSSLRFEIIYEMELKKVCRVVHWLHITTDTKNCILQGEDHCSIWKLPPPPKEIEGQDMPPSDEEDEIPEEVSASYLTLKRQSTSRASTSRASLGSIMNASTSKKTRPDDDRAYLRRTGSGKRMSATEASSKRGSVGTSHPSVSSIGDSSVINQRRGSTEREARRSSTNVSLGRRSSTDIGNKSRRGSMNSCKESVASAALSSVYDDVAKSISNVKERVANQEIPHCKLMTSLEHRMNEFFLPDVTVLDHVQSPTVMWQFHDQSKMMLASDAKTQTVSIFCLPYSWFGPNAVKRCVEPEDASLTKRSSLLKENSSAPKSKMMMSRPSANNKTTGMQGEKSLFPVAVVQGESGLRGPPLCAVVNEQRVLVAQNAGLQLFDIALEWNWKDLCTKIAEGCATGPVKLEADAKPKKSVSQPQTPAVKPQQKGSLRVDGGGGLHGPTPRGSTSPNRTPSPSTPRASSPMVDVVEKNNDTGGTRNSLRPSIREERKPSITNFELPDDLKALGAKDGGQKVDVKKKVSVTDKPPEPARPRTKSVLFRRPSDSKSILDEDEQDKGDCEEEKKRLSKISTRNRLGIDSSSSSSNKSSSRSGGSNSSGSSSSSSSTSGSDSDSSGRRAQKSRRRDRAEKNKRRSMESRQSGMSNELEEGIEAAQVSEDGNVWGNTASAKLGNLVRSSSKHLTLGIGETKDEKRRGRVIKGGFYNSTESETGDNGKSSIEFGGSAGGSAGLGSRGGKGSTELGSRNRLRNQKRDLTIDELPSIPAKTETLRGGLGIGVSQVGMHARPSVMPRASTWHGNAKDKNGKAKADVDGVGGGAKKHSTVKTRASVASNNFTGYGGRGSNVDKLYEQRGSKYASRQSMVSVTGSNRFSGVGNFSGKRFSAVSQGSSASKFGRQNTKDPDLQNISESDPTTSSSEEESDSESSSGSEMFSDNSSERRAERRLQKRLEKSERKSKTEDNIFNLTEPPFIQTAHFDEDPLLPPINLCKFEAFKPSRCRGDIEFQKYVPKRTPAFADVHVPHAPLVGKSLKTRPPRLNVKLSVRRLSDAQNFRTNTIKSDRRGQGATKDQLRKALRRAKNRMHESNFHMVLDAIPEDFATGEVHIGRTPTPVFPDPEHDRIQWTHDASHDIMQSRFLPETDQEFLNRLGAPKSRPQWQAQGYSAREIRDMYKFPPPKSVKLMMVKAKRVRKVRSIKNLPSRTSRGIIPWEENRRESISDMASSGGGGSQFDWMSSDTSSSSYANGQPQPASQEPQQPAASPEQPQPPRRQYFISFLNSFSMANFQLSIHRSIIGVKFRFSKFDF